MAGTYSLGEIARFLDAEVRGDAELRISGLNTLQDAVSSELAFLANEKYVSQLAGSSAAAVIISPKHIPEEAPVNSSSQSYSGAFLVVDNPYLGYARISSWFETAPQSVPAIHDSAVIHSSARIGTDVSIGPNVVVEANAVVADNCTLGPGSYLGARSHLGEGSVVSANVSIYHDVTIGCRARIHSSTVIGADGFGFAADDSGGWQKIHQIGGVAIGDDVEVGACTTIDRGALGDTRIGNGVIIDNHVQIAHNVVIGDNSAMAAYCGISGSSTIGRNCTLAGDACLVGHISLCDNVHVTARTLVTKSITSPGSYSSGMPMMETREWRKNTVRIAQLDSISRRLKQLEKNNP